MPTYRVEAYIAHAIECVQAQTFADWELIVVDDCSPDASRAIAESFTAKDSRIRIVCHGQNQGLAAARNTGIAEAKGSYLWMPDPDDWYESDLLANAHDVLAGQAGTAMPDAVLFGYAEDYFDTQDAFLYEHKVPLPCTLAGATLAQNEWRRSIAALERSTHYGYAWNKIYCLARIRNLDVRFEPVRLIEDISFNVAFFQDAGNVAFLQEKSSEPLYHYAKRQGKSLTNANEYGAQEYYDLHRRRIQLLRDQFVSWGVLDERAKSILGSLYARFILSALMRFYDSSERPSCSQLRQWCTSVFSDPLFQELIPVSEAESSRALAMWITALKQQKPSICLAIGQATHFARAHLYPLFTKIRSGR